MSIQQSPYPKLSLSFHFKSSSQAFSPVIGVVSNLVSVAELTRAGVVALVATLPQLKAVRAQLDTLALRPALLAELDRDQTFTAVDRTLVEDTADGVVANTYDVVASLKQELKGVDIVYVGAISHDTMVTRAKAFSAGANVVMLDDKKDCSMVVFADVKSERSVRYKLGLDADKLPEPKADADATGFKSLVKVCGIKTVEAAKVALESGADMIGMILVPGRSRTVDTATAIEISAFVRGFQRPVPPAGKPYLPQLGQSLSDYKANCTKAANNRPQIVGVFRNQPLATVLELQKKLSLDVVQLHGDEPLEWCRIIPVPVIKRFTPGTPRFEMESLQQGYFTYALLDGELGGEGKLVDRSQITKVIEQGARFILAGGLTPENVAAAAKHTGIIGVDVSGGVETNGVKDLSKIKGFVTNAKQA
jgi:phosphoribosylanthranilate isomerase